MLNLDKITDKDRTVKWPVKIKVPQDGGKVKTHTIKVTYRSLGNTGLVAASEQAADDHALISALVVDIQGVQDADGNEYPYNDELISKLVDVGYISEAIFAGYSEARSGGRSKN